MFLFLKQSSLHGMKCNRVEPNSRSNLHPPSDQTSTHGNPISSMDLIIHHNHRIYNTTLKSTNSFSYTHSHTPKLYYHSTMQVGGGVGVAYSLKACLTYGASPSNSYPYILVVGGQSRRVCTQVITTKKWKDLYSIPSTIKKIIPLYMQIRIFNFSIL